LAEGLVADDYPCQASVSGNEQPSVPPGAEGGPAVDQGIELQRVEQLAMAKGRSPMVPSPVTDEVTDVVESQ